MLISDAQPAGECSSIHEIRTEIDRIDRVIISMLGDRLTYVRAAAEFKTSDASVRALDRVESMLGDREQWAADVGLEPTVIRTLYEDLIRYFTDFELEEWSGRTGPDGDVTGRQDLRRSGTPCGRAAWHGAAGRACVAAT